MDVPAEQGLRVLVRLYPDFFLHLPLDSKQVGTEGRAGCVVQGSWGGDHPFFLSSSLGISFPLTQVCWERCICSQN